MVSKRIKTCVITVVAAMFLLTGCADLKKMRQIEVGDVTIESVSPKGFRGAVVNLSVEVDNPASQIALTEISGAIEHSGKVLGRFAVDPVTLNARTAGTYKVRADVTLGEEATLMDLGRLLDKKALEESLVDVSAKVQIRKGACRNVSLEDIPLKKLLDSLK